MSLGVPCGGTWSRGHQHPDRLGVMCVILYSLDCVLRVGGIWEVDMAVLYFVHFVSGGKHILRRSLH